MKIKTADCKSCGERIFTQFQEKCPNGCDETAMFPGRVKERETEIPDEDILALIESLEESCA